MYKRFLNFFHGNSGFLSLIHCIIQKLFYFSASEYHELKPRPNRPHLLFRGFIVAAKKKYED